MAAIYRECNMNFKRKWRYAAGISSELHVGAVSSVGGRHERA